MERFAWPCHQLAAGEMTPYGKIEEVAVNQVKINGNWWTYKKVDQRYVVVQIRLPSR